MRTFVLLSLLLALQGFSQQPTWLTSRPVTYSFNPGGPQHVLASSQSGNLMAAHVDLGIFTYGNDVFGSCSVERVDPTSGLPLWTCALQDSVTVESGAVDDEGNVYMAGHFMGALTLCDGTELAHTGVWWDVDLYLLKFDPNGVPLWARNISLASDQASMIPVVTIDPAGNAWYGTSDFFESRVARVDALGEDEEVRIIAGAKTLGGMAFAPSGALYLSGACDGYTFSFGGLDPQLSPDEPYQMFLLRYDALGHGDWVEFAHDITFQFPDVAVDGAGNAFVACNTFDSTGWGDITLHHPDWGSSTFLVKADSTGEFLWGVESENVGSTITGDMQAASRDAVTVDGAGNAYLTGTLRGLVDWGNGVASDGTTLLERTQTIVAFDSDGAALWATTSAPSGSFVNAMGVTSSQDGTVYFSAHTSGAMSFPPLSTNENGEQALVIGRMDATSTAVRREPEAQSLIAWPSPTHGIVHVRSPYSNRVPFDLFSATGRLVRSGTLQLGSTTIDMTTLDRGAYLLRTADGSYTRVLKD